MNYCPECGCYLPEWDTKGGKCGYCGFDAAKFVAHHEVEEEAHCTEHLHYEGIGLPKNDCLECWKMHRQYVENKIQELSR